MGTQCDTLSYADLRVPGLVAENARRRGPGLERREALLEQLARDVARLQDESWRPGHLGQPAFAQTPRPARRGRSVGVSADRRDFHQMRFDALQWECRTRGLSLQGPRHDLLRRVLSDVERHEREVARSVNET